MPTMTSKLRQVGHLTILLDDDGLATAARLAGRALYLTHDRGPLRTQLQGATLTERPVVCDLFAHVSTDAIIKANPDCYYYDDRLGDLLLRSLGNGGYVEASEIRQGGFGLILAGEGWGEGSSREVAARALLIAGIGAVFAPSIAPIHRQNLINNGMLPITDPALAWRMADGETLAFDELLEGFDATSRRILRRGGLFPFMQARSEGKEPDEAIATPARAMTLAEKIMARRMKTRFGAVRPGDTGFLEVDAAFSHDYTTAPAAAAAEAALGRPVRVQRPATVHSFPDHLTLASRLPGIDAEALAGIADLRMSQRALAERTGMHWHATPQGTPTGICHTVIREQVALPGQVIVGTDSHTCSAGALNCLAYGVGNSEIAAVWEWNVLGVRVPRTVRVQLEGRLPAACTAKDVMLHLAGIGKASGIFTGRVIEFGGSGLETLMFDEQAVLANMAVECNALTAVCEPTLAMIDHLAVRRQIAPEDAWALCLRPDPEAEYERVMTVDLGAIQTLVARPGHPGNGVPLEQVLGTPLDLAYGGSCTAGDLGSIAMYAEVFSGRRVRIPTYVQYGSQLVQQQARQAGYHDVLVAAGVTVIDEPGCGACISAGPGGPRAGQVAISATNRNMPGRMGDGDVYLANPRVLAASAVAGCIAEP
ncbi:3-isopropylmalate/(R)-2-methylmalate dehydratase large subunit [Variovorax sp. PDC80]|nr:3-isopropylmalate/(R)-2-methylmalate dehydratase large subunit [Variovorax sp. PDC80]